MSSAETAGSSVSEKRKGYFVAALRELHERSEQDHNGGQFDLPRIAKEASHHDPTYDPRNWLEQVAGLVGIELTPTEKLEQRRRAYPGGRQSAAAAIMAELVETGQVETAEIAGILLDEETGYGSGPNEDGMLYRLVELPEGALGASAGAPVPAGV